MLRELFRGKLNKQALKSEAEELKFYRRYMDELSSVVSMTASTSKLAMKKMASFFPSRDDRLTGGFIENRLRWYSPSAQNYNFTQSYTDCNTTSNMSSEKKIYPLRSRRMVTKLIAQNPS